MKKKMNYVIMTFMLMFAMASCSQTEDAILNMEKKSVEVSLTRSSTTSSILSFADQADFDETVAVLKSISSSDEKLKWVNKKYPNFISIQEEYGNALAEADSLDGSEASFLSFIDKYDTLYFPLEGEDAGFYIPMTNLEAAFLVNRNCEVRIGSETRCLKDIDSYSQLFELGRTYYNVGQPILSADGEYSEFKFDPGKSNIGERYESGWRYNGKNDTEKDADRKLNLKINRFMEEKSLQIAQDSYIKYGISQLHIEISFRKKTWLGWTNYSSETSIKGVINLGDIQGFLNLDESHSGTSSHDINKTLGVYISNQNNQCIATFPHITGNLKIAFRGFTKEQDYDVKMNGAFCSIPAVGYVVPKLN